MKSPGKFFLFFDIYLQIRLHDFFRNLFMKSRRFKNENPEGIGFGLMQEARGNGVQEKCEEM